MMLILSNRSLNLVSQDKIGQGGSHMPIAQSIPTRRIYVSPVLVFVRPDEFCTPKTELNIYFYIVRKRFLYVKSHLIYGNPESSTLRIVSRGSNFKMFSKLQPRQVRPRGTVQYSILSYYSLGELLDENPRGVICPGGGVS